MKELVPSRECMSLFQLLLHKAAGDCTRLLGIMKSRKQELSY